jgi:hypothetical protein
MCLPDTGIDRLKGQINTDRTSSYQETAAIHSSRAVRDRQITIEELRNTHTGFEKFSIIYY